MSKADFCYKKIVPEFQTEYAFGDKISDLERHNVKNNNKKI